MLSIYSALLILFPEQLAPTILELKTDSGASMQYRLTLLAFPAANLAVACLIEYAIDATFHAFRRRKNLANPSQFNSAVQS